MRKYLLTLILIIAGVLCFSLIMSGLEFGDFKLVKSYDDEHTILVVNKIDENKRPHSKETS